MMDPYLDMSDLEVTVPMPQDEHAALRAELVRACRLPSTTVQMISSLPGEPRMGAALKLLVLARIASIDSREVYYSPAIGWEDTVLGVPVAGMRESVALSPRNETAACALVLELLTTAGAERCAAVSVVRPEVIAMCDAALAPPDISGAPPPTAAPPDDGGVGDAMVAWVRSTAAASTSGGDHGLTLVHFSAQLERFVWDRGCASGLCSPCQGGVWGYLICLGCFCLSDTAKIELKS